MNQLFYGDCLDVLKNSINDESIDLIYIDPPFNSKRNYNVLFEAIDMTDVKAQKEAFADTWSNVKYVDQLNEINDLHLDLYYFLDTLNRVNIPKGEVSYLTIMALRIYYMHRKLKSTGSFYLHCDANMSHYLKIVCDLIFRKKNLIAEIIWGYGTPSGGRTAGKKPVKGHDVILYYAKNFSQHTYNKIFLPYNEKYIRERFVHTDDEERQYRTRKRGDVITRQYLDESPGVPLSDCWTDIKQLYAYHLVKRKEEELGYPTQKPEALLERIIKASSNEGDVVADFFCGCGTAVAVAEKLNRKWIGVDISHLAIKLILERVLEPYRTNNNNDDKYNEVKQRIEVNGFPRDIASARELATGSKKGRLKFQDWVVEFLLGGVSNPKKVGDGGYDGYLTIHRDAKKKDIVLIEVKSGGVNVKNVREFIHVTEHEKATMGLFVCFADSVTKPMQLEAQQGGYYDPESYGTKYPRIQIITIEDLLKGGTFAHPNPSMFNITFKKAR